MKIIIFDIDGTLLQSFGFDGHLYRQSVLEVLGDVRFRPDWGDYEHVTDAGILREIIEDNELEHSPLERVRDKFGELISGHLHQNPSACPPVPGAPEFLAELHQRKDMRIGIATGGWGHTARAKLRAGGIEIDNIPLTSSDDDHTRTGIMQTCLATIGATGAPVTYVGDGEWDQNAAAHLGWSFIGVGERLKNRCENWVPDFRRFPIL